MVVNTKIAQGRRLLRYDNFEQLIEDAELLAAGEFKTVGNWTFAQILQHISFAINCTMDGFDFQAPWPMRMMANLFMKKKFLKTSTPAGYKIPTKLKRKVTPSDVPIHEALDELRAAVSRLASTETRAPHPFFGTLTKDESDRFQLRHAELHMSFVVPE